MTKAEYDKQYYLRNRAKRLAQNKQWRKDNPEKFRRQYRRQSWKKLGMDPDEAQAVWDANVACEVCSSPEGLCVDHDHNTGRVRGVLCHACNLSAGKMGEDPDRLERLATYIRQRAGETKDE